MKRRGISAVLSIAMALSLMMPAPAAAETGAATGTVIVDNVPGGMLVACTEVGSGTVGVDSRIVTTYLPVGEPVVLPVGTVVHVIPEPMYYCVNEGTEAEKYVWTVCDKVELVKDGDTSGSEIEYGSYTVEGGETVHIVGSFVEETPDPSEDSGDYDYEGTITGASDQTGYTVTARFFCGEYLARKNPATYSYANTTYSSYLGEESVKGTATIGELLDILKNDPYKMYNGYEPAGYQIEVNESDEPIADGPLLDSTLTVAELAGESGYLPLFARYARADGTLYAPRLEPLKSAADELEEKIAAMPTATASSAQRDEFDQQAEAIADEIKAAAKNTNASALMEIIEKFEEKLSDALGVKAVPSGGVAGVTGALLASGVTSTGEAEKYREVRVHLKDGVTVSTASDADHKAEFELQVEKVEKAAAVRTIAANTEPGTDEKTVPVRSLDTPMTVTVEMPQDYIGVASGKDKLYAGDTGKEIAMNLDTAAQTITFTTVSLGKHWIKQEAETDKPVTPPGGNSGNVGSGYSGSSVSAPVNRNASGSWVQEADGRWWFKYSLGGYPANKWEMINNKWYYFNAEGYMASGWQLIDNVWYHLDDTNGDMTTGWYLDAADGKWYYFNASGAMLTGWQVISGVYYYLTETMDPTYTYDAAARKWVYSSSGVRPYGSMYVNETTPDGYKVDENGARVQ